jgi:hypothetical protein
MFGRHNAFMLAALNLIHVFAGAGALRVMDLGIRRAQSRSSSVISRISRN